MKMINAVILTFFLVCVSVFSGCVELQGYINSTSQISSKGSEKLKSVLIVIPDLKATAGSELETLRLNAVVALKHRLTEEGLKADSLYLTTLELDPAKSIFQTAKENGVSHVIELKVMNAEIRKSGSVSNVENYNVKLKIVEFKSKSVVWQYAADIKPGKGGNQKDLAESILNSLKKDGVL